MRHDIKNIMEKSNDYISEDRLNTEIRKSEKDENWTLTLALLELKQRRMIDRAKEESFKKENAF
jgi:hypothetical protein